MNTTRISQHRHGPGDVPAIIPASGITLLSETGTWAAAIIYLGVADPNAGSIVARPNTLGLASDGSLWTTADGTTWTASGGGGGATHFADDVYLTFGTANYKLGLSTTVGAFAETLLLGWDIFDVANFETGSGKVSPTPTVLIASRGFNTTGGLGGVDTGAVVYTSGPVFVTGAFTGGSSGPVYIASGDVITDGTPGSVVGDSGVLAILSGDVGTDGVVGSGGGASSGIVRARSGHVREGDGSSGDTIITTGDTPGAGDSGDTVLNVGAATGSGRTGSIRFDAAVKPSVSAISPAVADGAAGNFAMPMVMAINRATLGTTSFFPRFSGVIIDMAWYPFGPGGGGSWTVEQNGTPLISFDCTTAFTASRLAGDNTNIFNLTNLTFDATHAIDVSMVGSTNAAGAFLFWVVRTS